MEMKTSHTVLECTSSSVASSMFYKDIEAGHVMKGNYTAFYGVLCFLKHSQLYFLNKNVKSAVFIIFIKDSFRILIFYVREDNCS